MELIQEELKKPPYIHMVSLYRKNFAAKENRKLIKCENSVCYCQKMILLRPYMMEESSSLSNYAFFKLYYKVTGYDQFKDVILKDNIENTSETLKVINCLCSIDVNSSFKRVAEVLEKIKETKNQSSRFRKI